MSKLISEEPKFQPFIMALKANVGIESVLKDSLKSNEQRLKDTSLDANNKKLITDSLDRTKTHLQTISLQKATLGPDNYPLSGSASPLVNQIFDIAYKYYFGETVTASNVASGAWTALVATFGSLGAIAVVGAIVYFVFLR
jgi:hypothetical protein